MDAATALSKMVPPGQTRPSVYQGGVLQIWITRTCDKACNHCTQGSNLRAVKEVQQRITPEQFEKACLSLSDYFGVVGMFGGNPAIHPEFETLCYIFRKHIPFERRGLWCNNPLGKGKIMAETFNPAVSNLNVHLDQKAYDEFKRDWPSSMPFGLTQDSRHAPVYVSMKDLNIPEEERWEKISNCDINQKWSAMIGIFRGELRGYFCEIAGAMAMLHQHNPEYLDTGVPIESGWWKLPMSDFSDQVHQCCHNCGVPLRGFGTLAQEKDQTEIFSIAHSQDLPPLKIPFKPSVVIDSVESLKEGAHKSFTDYLGNAR